MDRAKPKISSDLPWIQPEDGPAILGNHRQDVEEALDGLVNVQSQGLQTMLRYHLGMSDEYGNPISSNQGKRFRSSLSIFACKAVGGSIPTILPAAAAIELVHNFSLIHDDIQDNDLERRHRATLWALWGKPKALQAGNVMRTMADLVIQQLNKHCDDDAMVANCSRLLTAGYLETVEGQFLDLSYEGRTDIDTSKYLNMISKKTGALIRTSMNIGALIGHGDKDTIKALANCGEYLGYVFQVRDDYLGTWGSESETGKAIGNDIMRKKNSLPIVHAIEHADSVSRQRLKILYQKEHLVDQDIQEILDILSQVGTAGYVKELAEKQATYAISALEDVKIDPALRNEFQELVHFLLTRKQ